MSQQLAVSVPVHQQSATFQLTYVSDRQCYTDGQGHWFRKDGSSMMPIQGTPPVTDLHARRILYDKR
jgi:hypothetical protein